MNNDERILQILDRSACLSSGQMMAYVKGTLVPEELRAVELHLAECDLCNDAIEGFEKTEQPAALIKSMTPPQLPVAEPEKKPAAAPAAKAPTPNLSDTVRKTASVSSVRPDRLRKRRKNPLSGAIGIAALLLAGIFAIWFFEIRNGRTHRERPLAEERASSLYNDTLRPAHEGSSNIVRQPATMSGSSEAGSQSENADRRQTETTAVADTSHSGVPATNTPADSPSLASLKKTGTPTATDKQDSGKSEKKIAAAAPVEPPASEKKTATAKTTRKKTTPDAKNATAVPHTDFETGVALYKKKEYASALLYLNTVTSDKDNPRYWDGLYYSALCNLALGKEGRAKRYLRRVARSSAAVKNAAAQKLEALEKE